MIMNGTCHLLYLNQAVISVHGVFSRCLVVPLSCVPDLKLGPPQKRLASNQFYLIQALVKHMVTTSGNRQVGKGFWNTAHVFFHISSSNFHFTLNGEEFQEIHSRKLRFL